MDFSFDNEILTVKVEKNYEIDNMSVGMLTNNAISGIAPLSISQLDETKIFRYEVTGFVPLRKMLDGVVNLGNFILIIKNILNSVILTSEYMLEEKYFLLSEDYIFINLQNREIRLIMLPVENVERPYKNVGEMVKNILFSSQFDYGNFNLCFGKMVNYLNGSETYSNVGFLNVIKDCDVKENEIHVPNKAHGGVNNSSSKGADAVKKEVEKAVAVQPQQSTVQKTTVQKVEIKVPEASAKEVIDIPETKEKPKKKGLFGSKKKEDTSSKKDTAKVGLNKQTSTSFAVPGQDVSIDSSSESKKQEAMVNHKSNTLENINRPVQVTAGNFGETTVLNAGNAGETTVLDATYTGVTYPYLVRTKTGDRISIDKPVFRIGKEKSYVDYFVSDNAAISRSHANIKTENGKFFIIDTHSTNHTFVNGKMILDNDEKEIFSGDHIRLGNEEFEFFV